MQAPETIKEPKKIALRPKLAASLILTRTQSNGTKEVLLGRRSGHHVFMPKKYVFPGGRVDRIDTYAPLARELSRETSDLMGRALSAPRARAVAAAALRETAEETGLLIAQPGAIRSAHPAWAPFRDAGVQPTAEPLRLMTRAITPPGRKRRFDAWFFHVDVDHLYGQQDPVSNGELEDLKWVDLDEARHLDIPHITHFVLEETKAQLKTPQPIRYVRTRHKCEEVVAL